MCKTLTVDIGHRRHNLSEKNPGLLLRQTVLCYDVIKQLSTGTVLKEEGTRSQFKEWLTASSHHILCVHVCLPPVPWRSEWRSLWPGRDDRHADGSGSSWPQSPPSHGAGHPEESHNTLFMFSLCKHEQSSLVVKKSLWRIITGDGISFFFTKQSFHTFQRLN